MNLTYKYIAYTNKETQTKFDEQIGLCCDLYNLALEQRIKAFKSVMKRSISYFDQSEEVPEFIKEHIEYKKVYSRTLREALKRLDKSFQNFFRRVKNHETPGFPRFKSKDRYTTLSYRESGWKLKGKYITFSKLGTFKMKLSRSIEGVIKQILITKKGGNKFQICFVCDNVPLKILPKTNKSIGIDLGCKDIITTSDENKVTNPKFLKHSEEKLKLIQSQYSKYKNKKIKLRLIKLHEKVRNQRLDFNHKLSRDLINNYDNISVENIDINQLKNKTYKGIRKSITDASWGQLLNQLVYKAEYAGRRAIKVNPRNTSKMCSNCGELVNKKLSDRIHKCKCGLILDRDINASKNILRAGQALLNGESLSFKR